MKDLALSSAKMAVATFSSRILGLVRELSMAAYFGASGMTDAFLVAYRIPNMLRDLFAEGAFSSAFVPVFTEVREKDPQEARRLLWSLFVLLGLITLIISIAIIIFAPELASLFAPSFKQVPDKFQTTVILIRIMAPFLALISMAALFMGALNSLKVFFIPSFAPVFFNVVMIFSIIFVPPLLTTRGINAILALGLGVIVGGLAQVLFQVPMIFKKAYGPMGPITLFSQHTKKIINRIGIGTIGIAATQINLLVNTILASGTVVGAVSWLSYAFRLFQFPVGILSVSIANTNLVHFSEAWKRGERESAISFLKTSYTFSFLVIIPAMSLLLALSQETVHLILERGRFDAQDTAMTGLALRYYLLGLPFYGLYKIFAPTFFALDRPKIPVICSVFAIAFNVVFCILMTPKYGFSILAFGTSLSMLLNTVAQSILLKRTLSLSLSFFINLRIIKIVISGIICFVVVNFLREEFLLLTDSFGKKLSLFLLISFAGATIYGLILVVMGEWSNLKRFATR